METENSERESKLKGNDGIIVPRERIIPPSVVPFSPQKLRESSRAWITAALVLIFSVVVLLPILGLSIGFMTAATASEVWGKTLPTVAGLLGAAVGYYFGTTK